MGNYQFPDALRSVQQDTTELK